MYLEPIFVMAITLEVAALLAVTFYELIDDEQPNLKPTRRGRFSSPWSAFQAAYRPAPLLRWHRPSQQHRPSTLAQAPSDGRGQCRTSFNSGKDATSTMEGSR